MGGSPADSPSDTARRPGLRAGQRDHPPRATGAYWRHGPQDMAILAAVLAIRAAFTAMGWMSALLETFLVIGLIAAVVVIAVSLVAKRRRPG